MHSWLDEFGAKRFETVALGIIDVTCSIIFDKLLPDVLQKSEGKLVVNLIVGHAEDKNSILMRVMEHIVF